ncbi:YbjQ family protein [Marinicella sp. W31]|uniref:YbjQ family protein n=1 Tax=Marinicella sp. W31 TaxID=3023713 RepID=UPI003757E065
MIVSNLELIFGKKIKKHLGLVQGSSVRAKHVGKDFFAGLKNLVGGELKAYTDLLQESREEATERMKQQAKSIGANAILNVRYSTSSIAAGAAEIYVYGTAVVLEEHV